MDCFEKLGYVFLATLVYKFACIAYNLFWPYVVGQALGLTQDPAKLGKWAVVTGATDGIGKAYAEALAARGMNVYLMSRTETKLQAVADEIKSQCPNVEVRTYQLDFGTDKLEDYDNVEKVLGSMDVGVLVNNVGMSLEHPQYFLDTPRQEIKKLLLVNDLSYLMMTNIVLKGMVERKRGALINIASILVRIPSPLLGLYCASKVFLDYFTQTLPMEYADSGVIFQLLTPARVKTNMSKLKKSSFWDPEPQSYVKDALGTLGLMNHGAGCLSHAIEQIVLQILPVSIIMSTMFKLMKSEIKKIPVTSSKEQ